MVATSAAEVYKTQQIMTKSPEELTLMLYDGALRYIHQSLQALDQQRTEEAHKANMRAQDIVLELMSTLDLHYEIAGHLLALYDYIQRCLVQGNLKKEKGPLEEAADLIKELRDTWAVAVQQVRTASRGGREHG